MNEDGTPVKGLLPNNFRVASVVQLEERPINFFQDSDHGFYTLTLTVDVNQPDHIETVEAFKTVFGQGKYRGQCLAAKQN